MLLRIFVPAVIVIFFYLIYRQRRELPRQKRHFVTYLLAACAVLLTLSMVRYPQEAFEASVAGLKIWWQIVFPALLPFFVFAQLLIGLGVVHMMGVFLEPVMRPVFNVPGTGSFVMAMGLASGFPIGSVLAAELRTRNLCNRVEAERLLSFTNTADPLFMFGAVAVGMLGYPQAGVVIAVAHYLSSLSLGVLLRFYRRNEPASADTFSRRRGGLIARALHALVEARQKDGRPLGQLMGDAVRRSMDTLMLIGGFIILFSVIIRILDLAGLVGFLGGGLQAVLRLAGLDPALAPALVSGFFEIDLGCQYTAAAAAGYGDKVIAVGMIIAWSGLSVHAQVASIISKTDIRLAPYLAARVIHALLAGAYTALLLGPGEFLFGRLALPVFLQTVPTGSLSFWWARTVFMANQALIFCGVLLVLSAAVYFGRMVRVGLFYSRRRY